MNLNHCFKTIIKAYKVDSAIPRDDSNAYNFKGEKCCTAKDNMQFEHVLE